MPGAGKWDALRELAVARSAFGLSDRDITVLQALVSFHPGNRLGGDGKAPVVFPSNQALCERLNGMPGSTLRRHLARLVDAGLLLRRDSPNGKRYCRGSGSERVAFGFDLSALVTRFAEIAAAAERARAERARLDELRHTLSLMRRDLTELALYGRSLAPSLPLWAEMTGAAEETQKLLRRKPVPDDLETAIAGIGALLTRARRHLDRLAAEEMSASPARNEQHIESSKKNPDKTPTPKPRKAERPASELAKVLETCTRLGQYHPEPIRHWHDLIRAADRLRPMMGISESTWRTAKAEMGPDLAAASLAGILQRFEDIRSPGAYLAELARRAQGSQL